MANDIYLIDPSGDHNHSTLVVTNGLCSYVIYESGIDQTLIDLDGRLEPCEVPCQASS